MIISLIVTVYNNLALLEKCLEGISRQTRLPDEVILSDDGSLEDIVSLWRKLSPCFARPLKLIRQDHRGFRAARVRNNGAAQANGDLLVFLDQDIVVANDYLQGLEAAFHPCRFLVAYPLRLSREQTCELLGSAVDNKTLNSVLTPEQKAKGRRQYREDMFAYRIRRLTRLTRHGAKLRAGIFAVAKADYIKVNGFDEEFYDCPGEDDDLGRRLLAAGLTGYNWIHCNFPVHLHHQRNYPPRDQSRIIHLKGRKRLIRKGNYRCDRGLDSQREGVELIG